VLESTPEGPLRVQVFKPGDFALVGLAEGAVSGGAGAVVFDRLVDFLPFKKGWLEEMGGTTPDRRAKFYLVRVRGTSMEPTISDGEIVLLDTNEDTRANVVNDGIYALRQADGDIVIKRLFKIDAILTVISDNKKNSTYTINLLNRDLREIIVGRALWVGKELT
jgi:phage repressor protein C with HTH and peptisase S24 domain